MVGSPPRRGRAVESVIDAYWTDGSTGPTGAFCAPPIGSSPTRSSSTPVDESRRSPVESALADPPEPFPSDEGRAPPLCRLHAGSLGDGGARPLAREDHLRSRAAAEAPLKVARLSRGAAPDREGRVSGRGLPADRSDRAHQGP